MQNELDLSLYLITDRKLACGRPIESVVQEALDGGVSIVQIREKKCSAREFMRVAANILELTRQAGVPLIINDRIDIALAIGADGVHLGQDDIPCDVARKMLGPDAIIGISVTNVEQAKAANTWDINYIGVGPIFFTMTKEDCKPQIGFEGLRLITQISRHKVCAIGGIKSESVDQAIASGASGVAVVSAIMAAPDPRSASQELLNKVRSAKALLTK